MEVINLKKLIQNIGKDNPGAYSVVIQLQYFNRWIHMLRFLEKRKYIGETLYRIYKDNNQDIIKLGKWLLNEMDTEIINKRSHIGIKIPKFKIDEKEIK